MSTIIINAENKRYLSEVKEFQFGIPHGVVNKTKTDVGGTYCAINCKANYIVVVPFKDLIESITSDKNNIYTIFGIDGGSNKALFKKYISGNKVKKLVVTYDSFPKLIDWLKEANEGLDTFKVLIDEYHLILEDMDYRFTAIDGLMNNIALFKHFSFLSATPIKFEFEIDFLKSLPHYEILWNNYSLIRTIRAKSPNVYQSTCKVISNFQTGFTAQDIYGKQTKVEELYIFLNSVQGAKQIADTLKLDPSEVKFCCADRRRNKLTLGEYEIESVSSPNKKINFFTKKCFQGCNLFSNNGLIIVVSDAKKSCTLVDVSTTMEQIVGRLRTNETYDNCFKDILLHIFSTNNDVPTDEEFTKIMNEKVVEANILLETNNQTLEYRQIIMNRINIEADIVSIVDDMIVINNLKKQSFIFKQELKKSYKNGLMLRNNFLQSKKFLASEQRDYSAFDVLLAKATIVSHKDLYNDFIDNFSNEVIREDYLQEYPEFREYKEYLTIKEMNSLFWVKAKMLKRVGDLKQADKIIFKFAQQFNGKTILSSEIKQWLSEEFNKVQLEIAPKATIIEGNSMLSAQKTKLNGKPAYKITRK